MSRLKRIFDWRFIVALIIAGLILLTASAVVSTFRYREAATDQRGTVVQQVDELQSQLAELRQLVAKCVIAE